MKKKRASNYIGIYFHNNLFLPLDVRNVYFFQEADKNFSVELGKSQNQAARSFFLPWEVLRKKIGQH